MSVSIGFVALRGAAFPEFEPLKSELVSRWPDLKIVEGWGDDESDEASEDGQAPEDQEDESDNDFDLQSLFLTIDETRVVVALMPAPYPWTDLEGPVATSMLWQDAEKELRNHDHHLVISAMSDDADPVNLSTRLTQAIAAVAKSTENVVGIYYGNATLVVPPDLFVEMAQLLPDELPLFIWIDFRVGGNEQGTVSGFTTGMAALGHKEIECENATDDVGEFRERLFGLCHYLLENGPVIKDGNTVGEDAQERIKVHVVPSAFGHEGDVLRLNYESLNQVTSKPFWKFW